MNMRDLSAALRSPHVEIALLDESIARVGSYQDYFHSFCVINDDLYSLNGRLPVLPYYRIDEPDFHDDQIYLTRYARDGAGLARVEHVALGRGGDPRVVSDGRNAYGISVLVEHRPGSGRTVGALLHDLRLRQTVRLEVDAANFTYGKNWQPYLLDSELFIVHELTPFRVLKVHVESGRAEIVQEVDISFKLPCFHTSYPMFRGGCNAMMAQSALVGLGRATSQRYRHHPFLWSFDESGGLNILFMDFFNEFYRCGYNIIDPTSLFVHGDDLYLGLCCSERDWAHQQIVSHFLLRVPGSSSKPEGERLGDFFARRAVAERKGVPNLDRHLFFCIEMPSATASRHEFGGRISTGSAGHLVHGPYIRVEREARYCAALSYLTRSAPSTRAGIFDVTVSRLANGAQLDFRTLGSLELAPTNGNMAEAIIEFDTRGLAGTVLELRVYVEEAVELNAFHVRTWKAESGGCCWPPLSRMEGSGLQQDLVATPCAPRSLQGAE